jgi:hypothetical protein
MSEYYEKYVGEESNETCVLLSLAGLLHCQESDLQFVKGLFDRRLLTQGQGQGQGQGQDGTTIAHDPKTDMLRITD